MTERYPRLEINLAYLKENVEVIVRKCRDKGIKVAGVIKGATGLTEVAQAFAAGGVDFIASSRLEQLEAARNAGIDLPMMLIRIPMLSEAERVIEIANISLCSELEVLCELNRYAQEKGRRHCVILMADLGDLREGFWDKEELVDVAEVVEKRFDGLSLCGIGTNLGCYGSIEATPEKMKELIELAERVEERMGRRLEFISGAASNGLMRVWDGDMPERINLLRIGEGILLARDMDVFYGYDMSELHQDVFTLKAEVIEVKDKPTHPVGKIAVDAFGHRPAYVDRGMRRRALLGIGKVDYGSPEDLLPHDEGVEVIGASSDHTIVDIEDSANDYKVGDLMEFGICYATMVYLTNCPYVHIVYV